VPGAGGGETDVGAGGWFRLPPPGDAGAGYMSLPPTVSRRATVPAIAYARLRRDRGAWLALRMVTRSDPLVESRTGAVRSCGGVRE
jgi:hypothetical protein